MSTSSPPASSSTSPSDATLPDLVVFLHGSGDTGASLRAWVGDCAPDFEATLRAAGVAVAWPDAKPRPYSIIRCLGMSQILKFYGYNNHQIVTCHPFLKKHFKNLKAPTIFGCWQLE